MILAGHFNGKTDNQPIPECTGPYGEQVTNRKGATLSDFCDKLKQTRTKTICENYRGITLLPTAYKIFST